MVKRYRIVKVETESGAHYHVERRIFFSWTPVAGDGYDHFYSEETARAWIAGQRRKFRRETIIPVEETP